MQTVQETLGSANYAYHRSVRTDELEKQAAELTALLGNSWLSDRNRESAEALLWRIRAKIYALNYFTGGYNEDDYAALNAFADEKLAESQNKGYGNTARFLEKLSAFAKAAHAVFADAAAQADRVRTYDWLPASNSEEECREVAEIFRGKEAAAAAVGGGEKLFGEDVAFPAVKEEMAQELARVRAFAEDLAESIRLKNDERFLEENAAELRGGTDWARFEYYPELPGGARSLANAVVLCTPFSDEAELFAVKNSPAEVYGVAANAFEGRTAESINNIFDLFARRGANVLVHGLERYRGENKEDICRGAMRFGRAGRKIFLIDGSGERRIYDEALKAAPAGGFSAADVSFEYLSVPMYEEVIELFESSGMIRPADYEFVRTKLPFMGFVGLNYAVAAYASKKDWRAAAEAHSAQNAPAAKKYLEKIPSQALLIDKGWGDFSEDIVDESRREFDYDDIKAVDPKNIRKIMESDLTVYEKCGAIVRYCTVAGDDYSVWQSLDVQVQSERLTEATKLVMRALGVGIVPEVKVLEELENKTAGGLCCDGGKRILYRKDCVQNYAWTIDAVCHECHHAFQHMVMYGPWKDWYWTELGVTKGRKEEWLVNTGRKYFSNTKTAAYYVQVLECEARAFAKDCLRDLDRVWHTIDFD